MRVRCKTLSLLSLGGLCVALTGVPTAAGAQAAQDAGVGASADAAAQTRMNADALADFKRTDKALAAVFNHVAQRLPFPARKKLDAAERAWAAYRDAQAGYSASLKAGSGGLYPTAFNDARTRLTRQRIAQLKMAVPAAPSPAGKIIRAPQTSSAVAHGHAAAQPSDVVHSSR